MVEFGEYIKIFSLEHFIYLTGLVIIAFLLFYNKSFVIKHKDKISIAIIIVIIIQQILLYGSYFVLFDFSLDESLPFHLSRINSILGLIFLITKHPKIYNVLCYFGVFVWLSFLYPSRVYGITHPIGISYFINHVVTLLIPYFGMIAYNMKIQSKEKNQAFIWFLLYLLVVMVVNPLVDGNYFYLKYKPIFANLPDYLYLPGLILFTYLFFSVAKVFYLWIQKKVAYNA